MYVFQLRLILISKQVSAYSGVTEIAYVQPLDQLDKLAPITISSIVQLKRLEKQVPTQSRFIHSSLIFHPRVARGWLWNCKLSNVD